MNYYWEEDDVFDSWRKDVLAYKAVSELAADKKLYMRDAAYVIAVNRVVQAVKNRGWV